MLFGVLAPTLAGIWAINELLVRTVIDVRFQEVTIALLPIAVFAGGLRYFRAHYPDQVFLLDGDTRKFLNIDAIEAFSVLVLCVLGLMNYGLYGAVAGTTLGMFIGVVASFTYAIKAGGFQVMWVHYGRIIGACLAMVLVIKLMPFSMTIMGLQDFERRDWCFGYALVLAPFYYRETKEVLASMRG